MDVLREKLNYFGKLKVPFLFVIDFEIKNFYVEPLLHAEKDVLFIVDGFSNYHYQQFSEVNTLRIQIKKSIKFENYAIIFNKVLREIREGNTYLLNLTFPTEIEVNAELLKIFYLSYAPFRLYFKNKFVVFSPERFIKIENNLIKTYPMKGTIEASIDQAQEKILTDEKEKAEHITIVDLLRNDLAIVAKNVRVERFRYIENINAGQKRLLQVSSEICGNLENRWQERIGDILLSLLPAGSISGAPKKKTVEIIKTVEGYDRGFFTGVFGYFNGEKLDSAVMIRFIEQVNNIFFYKSGGGITMDSQIEKEYQEMLDKIYIPLSR